MYIVMIILESEMLMCNTNRCKGSFIYQLVTFQMLNNSKRLWVVTTLTSLRNWIRKWYKQWRICLLMTFLTSWRHSEIPMVKFVTNLIMREQNNLRKMCRPIFMYIWCILILILILICFTILSRKKLCSGFTNTLV